MSPDQSMFSTGVSGFQRPNLNFENSHSYANMMMSSQSNSQYNTPFPQFVNDSLVYQNQSIRNMPDEVTLYHPGQSIHKMGVSSHQMSEIGEQPYVHNPLRTQQQV